jgi:hypothetical protein
MYKIALSPQQEIYIRKIGTSLTPTREKEGLSLNPDNHGVARCSTLVERDLTERPIEDIVAPLRDAAGHTTASAHQDGMNQFSRVDPDRLPKSFTVHSLAQPADTRRCQHDYC